MTEHASSPSYETIRIDLLPGVARRPAVPTPSPVAKMTRVHGSRPSRLMESVVRSRYQELLQCAYDAVLITDLSGVVADTNARAEEFFLFERDQILNQPVSRFVVGADDTLIETLNEGLKNERFTLIQAYCQRSDGTSFPAEIAVSKLRLDHLRLCFFVRDTTRRTAVEELLRKEHKALQNAACGIVICDLDMCIEYANPAFAAMADSERAEDLPGTNLHPFLGEAVGAEIVKHVASTDTPWSREIHTATASGKPLDVQVFASGCHDAEERLSGVVFSFSDAASRRWMKAPSTST